MTFKCDGNVYHPLGGASYVFEKDLIKYINNKIKKNKVIISIGAQPNSSPHFGTLCVFSLAFSLAKKLIEHNNKLDVSVLFEVVDTAPSETKEIDGIKYQYDLKGTVKMDNSMKDFKNILNYLSKRNHIKYSIRNQNEFNSQIEIKKIIKRVVKSKEQIRGLLDPKKEQLRMRIACPKCGLVDKEGLNTVIKSNRIISTCPYHGEYKVLYNKESNRLEYNTPLRNLVRGMLYGIINTSKEYDYEIIRVTGGDYAGFYQEELLYKVAAICKYDVSKLPIILYCPQILDWSGAKLSKSLYVQEGAYKDLPNYLLNYQELYKKYGNHGLDIINNETDRWLSEPYRLFRNYTAYYFIIVFEENGDMSNDRTEKMSKTSD